MNRKATPILLAAVAVLSLMAYFSERTPAPPRGSAAHASGPRILDVAQEDMQQVSVKRDYWNSFTLARQNDGSWNLIDPSTEPASLEAVRRLLGALESLPALTTIDLPSDDTERYREYGLWEPRLTVTVVALDKDYTLVFGSDTPDGKGVYCAVQGQKKVYATSTNAVTSLSADLSTYRLNPAATPAATAPTTVSRPSPSGGGTIPAGRATPARSSGTPRSGRTPAPPGSISTPGPRPSRSPRAAPSAAP
ncbi:MAG: DUF4340 domain-containing protein [Candidatus Sumerlaeota bacterium]|nr:DUF4340 domain-containing protein [Candidatus Sumerlaeota bacterium]